MRASSSNRISCGLTTIGLVSLIFAAHAQLGETNFDGIWIDARMIHRSGDTRDLDCSISLEFTGSKATATTRMSPIRVIQAIDDTGRSLMRTKPPTASVTAGKSPWRASGENPGFWQHVTGLRSPATNATAIRLLEGEMELQPRTANTPSQVVRFKMENIRLPWIDPPNLQVVATDSARVNTSKHPSSYRLWLTFFGGPVTNCAGIKSLHVRRMETDDGQQLQLNESDRSSLDRFSPVESDSGRGRSVQKQITFDTPPGETKQIRVVEGEAELFFPSLANGAIVELGEFMAHSGESLANAALNRRLVKLQFLGRANFEMKKQEWRNTRATFTSVAPQTKMPTDVNDSLLFSLDDPDHRVIKFEFVDEKGEELHELTQVISTASLDPRTQQLRLYTFRSPPPEGTKLKVSLVTPESLRPVPFKVENLQLP